MEKQIDEMKRLRDTFLANLGIHNKYQNEKDSELRRETAAAIKGRYGPPQIRVEIDGSSMFRELTADEKAVEARPRSRIVKAPPPKPVDDRPSLLFTPILQGLRVSSADRVLLELEDKTDGTLRIIDLEPSRREDIFDALDNWRIDILGRSIEGRSGSAWVDTTLKDSAGRRVFAELTGIVPDDPSGMYFGELRAFKSEELPESLPESVNIAQFAAEELKRAQASWRLRMNGPESFEDRKRREEKADREAAIADGIAAALKGTGGLDAFGRPRTEPSNPQSAAL